jgi:hypothetical protein
MADGLNILVFSKQNNQATIMASLMVKAGI